MKTVDQLAKEIVDREGGYVNDPDDPGGPTKYGVTIHTARALNLDIDNDGDVDIDDIKALTREDAEDIFLEQYYYRNRIDDLPAALRPPVFDMQVNSGANAVKILQRVLNDLYGENLTTDGAIGPKTIAATERAMSGGRLVIDYGVARREWYYRLADRRPSSRKYATTRAGTKGGWIKRAEDFLPPEHHFSQDQHEARTAAW